MKPEAREKRDTDDIQFLLQHPQFQRFLWRVIQSARIFSSATDGSHDEAVSALARRNLGLEILEMVEAGQIAPHPDGTPVLTLIQTLREEANPPPQEAKRGRRPDQFNRSDELGSDDDG